MRQPKTQSLAPLISLERLSQKSFSIASLLKLANNHQSFDTLLDQCLPELLKSQFKINNVQNGKLILTCTSAKLMTKFRFIQDQVIDNLNAHIPHTKINTVQIKVRPNIGTNEKKSELAPQRILSKKNAQILLEEAEHTEDQDLRKILTNLANNTNKH